MKRIITTDYFRCDGCGVECRIDSVPSGSSSQHTIQHCPAGKGINIGWPGYRVPAAARVELGER